MGEALDCLNDRLDTMERRIKEKIVDQSPHIMGKLTK